MLPGTENETCCMEADLNIDDVPPMVELVSRILCWNRVGNPDKLDSSGRANWTWYKSEAERFVSTNAEKVKELASASLSQ